MQAAPRVAVFVDLENVGGPFIRTVAEFGATQGRVCHCGVYADWRRGYAQAWDTTLDVGGVPKQILRTGGKNSADIAIVVDVMDFLYQSADVQCYVLATGDSDFVPLAHRLRARGKVVIGAAPAGRVISDALVAACDRFEHLGPPQEQRDAPVQSQFDPAGNFDAGFVAETPTLEQVRAVLIDYLGPRDSVTAGAIGMHLLKLMPGFRYRALGHRTLSDLLRAQSDLLEVIPTAHELRVSLVPGARTPEGETSAPLPAHDPQAGDADAPDGESLRGSAGAASTAGVGEAAALASTA